MSATRVGPVSSKPNWKKPVGIDTNRTRGWVDTRRRLKIRFNRARITSCEIRLPQCWKSDYLSFSHTKRRGDIKTQAELERVVLSCAACSTAATGMGKVKEEKFLEKIIAKREVQP